MVRDNLRTLVGHGSLVGWLELFVTRTTSNLQILAMLKPQTNATLRATWRFSMYYAEGAVYTMKIPAGLFGELY